MAATSTNKQPLLVDHVLHYAVNLDTALNNGLDIAGTNTAILLIDSTSADGAIVDNLNRKLNQQDKVNIDHMQAKELRAILRREDLSLSQIAILFCLKNRKISSVIPGLKTIKELEEIINIRSLDDLTIQNLNAIASWYDNISV